MATDVPTPYALSNTGEWDGNDGNWSTFRISVGNPGQDFRVLPSTRGSGLWVPIADGCTSNDSSYCSDSRGIEQFQNRSSLGFQSHLSESWNATGEPSLNDNLDFPDSGFSGVDSVRLGYDQDTTALSQDAVVIGITDKDCHLGLLGLKPAAQNISLPHKLATGVIESLKDNGSIPSLSYSYTAGARYRSTHFAGSLILGGFDKSLFLPASSSFAFSDGNLRVGVQSIYTTSTLGSWDYRIVDESSRHFSVIDTTISHLWLPGPICDRLAEAFGLHYDNEKGFYLINETMHGMLMSINPSLTFSFGNETSNPDDATIDIQLPYAAFDLWMGYPFYDNLTRYFPIRRATDPSQYAIGRVLLQEAYLIVDYERHTFSLSQAIFLDPTLDPDIRTIHPVAPAANKNETASSSSGKSGIPVGSIAGITVGAFSALLLMAGTWLFWCRHKKEDETPESESYHPPGGRHELGTEKMDISKNRIEAGGDGVNEMEVPQYEIDGETTAVYELSAESRPVELGYSNSLVERALPER